MSPQASEDTGDVQVLVEDRFEQPRPPGRVPGSRSTSGHSRLVRDRERVLSIEDGRLRIGWLRHGGWGRASIAYGPVSMGEGLVLAVRALNGLMTAQSDPRPEGRRGQLRRLLATFPHTSVTQPVLRENLLIGWFGRPSTNSRPRPVAAVVHRAGDDATGELWFEASGRRVRIANSLQNLPVVYAISLSATKASLHAWSYGSAHGFGQPGSESPLAELPLEGPVPRRLWAAVHQPVLGEVRYRVDSHIEWVEVLSARDPHRAALRFKDPSWWEPAPGRPSCTDDFSGPPGDLADASTDGARWRRVLGEGVIERTGRGAARVRADLHAPNPGRTAYCLPWSSHSGVEVAARITPPGRHRGEGHQGRSGLVIWQDPDNHLVLNHFIDDGSVGVSISAFLRIRGHESMFEWDAVWSNVAQRVRWGEPFDLSVACDGRQFLCRIGGEPVLYRRLTDYRRHAPALRINGVGLVANWEWGDDTGTAFSAFSARPLIGEAEASSSGSASPATRSGPRAAPAGLVTPPRVAHPVFEAQPLVQEG